VEQLKEQELQQERQQLQQWQQQQQQAGGGDESDYEDDLAVDEALAGSATADGLQNSALQDAMPDHPDYHGRGWKPVQAAKAAEVDQQLEQQQQQQSHGSKHGCTSSSSSSSSSDEEAGQDSPELITLTAAGGSSKPGASAMSALLSDAAAAATGQGYMANAGSSNNIHCGHGACGMWGSGSSPAVAAAEGSSDQLLTVRSTTATAIIPAAAAPAAAPARARPVPPAKPLAPVRSRAAPVAVSFTQLSTPHLPAREQREVELKDIKRHAKVSNC
jgi:hypothetical protein